MRFLFLFLSVSLIALSCKKNKENSSNPPCICPPDFSNTDFEPAWSPDGKYIAFTHGDSGWAKTGIYLISPDSNKAHLWHAGVGVGVATWSPDGQWIAFNDGAQIWKKKLNGDSLTRLTFEGRNFFPAWSPDGQWIAYHNTDCGSAVTPPAKDACGILFKDVISNKKQWIVRGEYPEWLNAEKFVYVGLNEDLYSFSLLDSNVKKIASLSDKKAYDVRYPKYSFQNNKIIFTGQIPNIKYTQIWIMDFDGSGLKQLTNTQGYSCDWSPDGIKIVYTDSRSSNGRLWIMNADGSNKQQLTFSYSF